MSTLDEVAIMIVDWMLCLDQCQLPIATKMLFSVIVYNIRQNIKINLAQITKKIQHSKFYILASL